METESSTAAIGANSHGDIMRELEDDEVEQIGSLPDSAAAQGVTIDNNSLTLMGAVLLRMLNLDKEQPEQIQEEFSTDSSAVATTSAQTRDNTTREPSGTGVTPLVDPLPDDVPEKSGRHKAGLYHAEDKVYREVFSKLTEEQWETLRATLSVDSSLDFPMSIQVSGLFLGDYNKGDPVTGFEDLIKDINSLVKFLTEGDQTEPVSNFTWIRTLGAVPGSTESVVWDIFNNVLGFSTNHERPGSLKQYIEETYHKPARSPPHKFSITLADILDAGLEAEPTASLDEHLRIIENKVKILTPQWASETLDGYPNNRLAAALGIQSLGEEIYTSLNVLYGLSGVGYQSNLLYKAQSLNLMPNALDGAKMRVGLMRNQHARPDVLSGRVSSLQELIRYRKSWWPSLKRDMERNRREQPYLYWGALLAIFFGTSTVMQTVASVVSCYYAILAYRAMPQP